jgi:phage tail P2-like protein
MLNYFLKTCQNGLDIVLDVEKMPEWRLDEMAWELNCLYDYGAEVETKRGWIRDAYKNYRMHGTAEGVRQYLKIYFGESSVNEYWEFGGEAGEFNVTVAGIRTTENEKWIRRAVEKAKNVRSKLNAIIFAGGESDVEILSGAQTAGIAVLRESVAMS